MIAKKIPARVSQTILIVFASAICLAFCIEQSLAQRTDSVQSQTSTNKSARIPLMGSSKPVVAAQAPIKSAIRPAPRPARSITRIPQMPPSASILQKTGLPKTENSQAIDLPSTAQDSKSPRIPVAPLEIISATKFQANSSEGQSQDSSATIMQQSGSLKNAELASVKKTNPQQANFAPRPELGEHFYHDEPVIDNAAVRLPYEPTDFSDTGIYEHCPPDPIAEMQVYDGKHLNRTQQPLVNWGRPYYDYGQYRPSSALLGKTNLLAPQFLIYGDWRTAVASNIVNGDHRTQIATQLNLEWNLKLTATERFHAFVRPLDQGTQSSRLEIDSGNYDINSQFDFDFDTAFFEGDLGSMVGGITGEVMPFDLPFSIGQIPLLLQNGLWLEDAFVGVAATIPARNSRLLDISNMDTTFFYGYDNITSPVFQGDDDAAKVYGVTSFIDAMDGYFEMGYAYLEDRTALDRSYHNSAIAFTRRYGRLSNSVRLFVSSGQNPNGIAPNANGTLLLLENSFVSRKPYTIVPYFNMFAGFGNPQSVARAGGTGGVLKNTGINFASDGLTNFPTLDASGANAFGGAVGINMLADNLSHQLIMEFAFLQTMGTDSTRAAVADQYGVGASYQRPLSNSVIFATQAMYGFFELDQNVMGAKMELRKKF